MPYGLTAQQRPQSKTAIYYSKLKMILPSALLMILTSYIADVTASKIPTYQMIFSYALPNGSLPVSVNYTFGRFQSQLHQISSSLTTQSSELLDYNKTIGSSASNSTVPNMVKVNYKRSNEQFYSLASFNATCDNIVHQELLGTGSNLIFGYACGTLPVFSRPPRPGPWPIQGAQPAIQPI